MADRPSAEVLELLREIITKASAEGYPAVTRVKRRFAAAPWVDQEIFASPLLMNVAGYLVPTIRGLRLDGSEQAQVRLSELERVVEAIRELYRAGKIKVADHGLVAQEATIPQARLEHLIAHLPSTFFSGFEHSNDSRAPMRRPTLRDQILIEDPFDEEEEAPQSSAPRGPITLSLRHFRGLRTVEWSPDGVCLIAGPNGSGKTTLLEALVFLSDAFSSSLATAIRRQRGAAALRHLRAGDDGVSLRLSVGGASWRLSLDVGDGHVGELPEEEVEAGEQTKVRRLAYSPHWYLGTERRPPDPQGRVCLRMAWDIKPSPELAPLVSVLQGYRYHASYDLDLLRQGGKGGENDAQLSARGENLFVVLRNWKAAPRRFGDRFDWVLDRLKRAFPGVVEHLEFDPPIGEIVPARFYPPGERMGLPMARAADGVLVGLLHLTAVAGADEGAIVAIDEMENQLHPHAIRSLLEAMRELAEQKELTVLLTTHSPVLMNAFRDEPQRFFVTEISERSQPIALDRLQDPEWLTHFALGDLYDRLEIGAPPRAET